ncbi:MAG: SDR family oxidoreductase [Actinomycetota bacterium]|nr:SDR family oxidoreductase [Actinomycetota bacterium]
MTPGDCLAPGCLTGRVALVTGGGSGIGRATALLLARLGAQVVVMGRRVEALDETVALAVGIEGALPITALSVDLREFDQVDAALDDVLARHGRVDLLVNNAGGQFMAPAETVSANGFRAVTRLNLDAPWYLTTRLAARSMIPHGYGKVVSITMTPIRGIPLMAHSSAARAGMASLTQTLAAEWAQHGIRLVAVAPGIVHTTAWEGYGIPPEVMAKAIPAGRLQTPEDVAAVVAFFLSPAGDYVTGQTIIADGGWDLVGPYQNDALT